MKFIFFWWYFVKTIFGLTYFTTNSSNNLASSDFYSLDTAFWNVSNSLKIEETILLLDSTNYQFSINQDIILKNLNVTIK